MLNQSKIWAVALLVAVFAAGVVIGGPLWEVLSGDRPAGVNERGRPPDSRGRERRSYSDHLQEELDLTAEQRSAMDSILEMNQDEMQMVWRELRARIDTLRQEISSEVMVFLTEQQRERYRAMIERSKNRGDRDRARRNQK